MHFARVTIGTQPYLSDVLNALKQKYTRILIFCPQKAKHYLNFFLIDEGESVAFYDGDKHFILKNVRVNKVSITDTEFIVLLTDNEIDFSLHIDALITPTL